MIELVTPFAAGSGAVLSVNGKTGIVVLNAAEVGALPADTVIPSLDGYVKEIDLKQDYVTKTQLEVAIDVVEDSMATTEYVDKAVENIALTPGPKGEPGATPVKGVDYFTAEDQAAMVAAVVAALPVYGGEVE